jgi:hypothetical protein
MTTEQIQLDLEEIERMGVAEARELLQNLVATEPTADDEDKITIIQELKLPGDVSIEMLYQLVDYKYLEFADDVRVGMFLKWIPLKKPDEIRLKHGAVVCKIRETEDDEVYIVCRLLKRVGGRTVFFELNFDENLLFFKRY